MQAFDATETKEPTERPRNEKRVRIGGRLRPGALSAALPGRSVRRSGILPNGRPVAGNVTDDDGYFEMIVYASDAQRIADTKVETRMDMVEQARTTFHTHLARHVRDRMMRNLHRFSSPPRPLPEDPGAWTPEEAKHALDFPGSVEDTFFGIMNRSMRPLVSVEILEHLDAPVPPEVQQTIQAADVVRRTMAAGQASDELADLRKQLAELKAMLADKPAKKQTPQQ